jgi:hypothetical protein
MRMHIVHEARVPPIPRGDARIRARKCAPGNRLIYHFANEKRLGIIQLRLA